MTDSPAPSPDGPVPPDASRPDPAIRPVDRAALPGVAAWAAERLRPQPDYISHGEILAGRSPDGESWSANLTGVLASDFEACLDSGGFVLELCDAGGERSGLAAVFRDRIGRRVIATVEDVLVDPERRGSGLGARLMAEIERRCREMGVSQLLLESGIRNDRAHRFFEDKGFAPVSQVFLKSLD